MKGCGVPSKGNMGAREPGSTLTRGVSCMIVPLSLLVAEGAALKPEHGKCDRRRTSGACGSCSHHCSLSHSGIIFYRHC